MDYFAVFLINLLSILLSITNIISTDLKGFDDTVLFKINWPGKDGGDLLDMPDSESMMVLTSNKEKYKCIIPTPQDKSKDSEDSYEGPNALDILQPLFTQSSCTYRLESYWTYEVCHGRHVRQYHEDREVSKTKTQEYFLGKWDKTAHERLSKELDSGLHYPPPVKKMDGLSLPYLQLNLTDGTICDLNGKPRRTNILYVCYSMGKHEIYSFKETSTCEYELIVLSSLLCQHPKYKPQDTGEHPISCLPLDGAPRKPRNLRKIEAESIKLRHQRLLDDERLKKVFAVFSIDKIEKLFSENSSAAKSGVYNYKSDSRSYYFGPQGHSQLINHDTIPTEKNFEQFDKDGDSRVRLELRAIGDADKEDIPTTPTPAPLPPVPNDMSPVESFLSGKNCLQGGSGWWKFEFCYGRTVEQYHVEPDNSRTVVRLGVFDREAHIAWLAKNPHKRPKPLGERKQVSHYYGGGSLCDKTGQPRETEVKLKCVESSSQGAVSLYLIEPHTCQYILGVESPLVCQMLIMLDEYGLTDDVEDATIAAVDDSGIIHDEH